MGILIEEARPYATGTRCSARQLAATVLLCLAALPAMAAVAADIVWPPGWTVEHRGDMDRARPDADVRSVTLDLTGRTEAPAAALAAAVATFTKGSEAAGLDTECGSAAPVVLGAGRGIGVGCSVGKNGLPLLKSSFVAWAVPGGSAVLAYAARPGAFEMYLPGFASVVASARVP